MTDANPFDSVRMDIQYRREATEDSLRRSAQSLILDLQRMVKAIDDDLNINSLGVVQNTGSEIDRLCALRAEYITTVKRLDWLEEKVS